MKKTFLKKLDLSYSVLFDRVQVKKHMSLETAFYELSEQLDSPAIAFALALETLHRPVRLATLLSKIGQLPLHGKDFILNPQTRQVSFRDGRPIVTLTEKEALLLAALLRSPDAPPSKKELQREVLGYNGQIESDALAALGYRLKQKVQKTRSSP